MGPEPFVDAMTANPDFNVIVGGRAYDPAPFIAYAWFLSKKHIDNASPEELQTITGGFTHMGKVMECGGLCAEPKSPGAIATVYRNATFDIAPLDPRARCTPTSVAAHALYEKSRPDILHGPGGYLDLTSAKYEQLRDGRTVRVHGSLFYFSKSMGLPYQLKLEGATTIGYRTMYMGSVRDPILISQLDNLIERVKGYAAMQHREVSGCWELDFHIYGRQGNASASDSGVFLVGEVLASSQHLATSVASTARIATIHGGYPGQKATAGNFAFGVGGKTEIELGACPKFSIYHLMDLQDGEEHLQPNCDTKAAASIFSQSVSVIGKGRAQQQQVSDNSLHPSQASVQDKTTHVERESDISQEDTTSSLNGLASPSKLVHLARVLRSKNAGPYEITLDVMFESEQVYRLVQQSDMLNLKTVSDALKLPPKEIIWSGFFDPARAFKVTIPRVRGGEKVAAGSFMEDDVHGSQQHLGLVNMELPDSVLQGIANLQRV
ncbi:Caib baif family enzyme [Neofusicoccum parvum]|nr:Caib baif family enzyme [Neofusicoccum parvum]